MRLQPLRIAFALTGAAAGAGIGTAALLLSQRHRLIAYECRDLRDVELIMPELIVQSGAEYILAFPSVNHLTNSHLVSQEAQQGGLLPARWRFENSAIVAADAHGFQLRFAAEQGGGTLTFSSSSGELQGRPNSAEQGSSAVRRCQRLAALPASVAQFNGVPIDYLQQRPWPVPLLNPTLNQSGLRLMLARTIAGRRGSDYSYYKLVAPLPRSVLTPADEERLQSARKALASEPSSTETLWGYSGNSSATWEYSNERSEAEQHAATWCAQQSEGSLQAHLSDGYQIMSSTPQSRESGRLKHLYPDGRFAGYVNYTASCAGTQYTLRKEGDLSALP